MPPWRSSAMSSMLPAPATIAAISEVTFNPGVRTLVRRHRQMLISQRPKPGVAGQRQHRHQSWGQGDIAKPARWRWPKPAVLAMNRYAAPSHSSCTAARGQDAIQLGQIGAFRDEAIGTGRLCFASAVKVG